MIECPTILVPAYDRSYNTIEEVEKDWREGKDFKLYKGPYCSIRDFSGEKVHIKYKPGMYVETRG